MFKKQTVFFKICREIQRKIYLDMKDAKTNKSKSDCSHQQEILVKFEEKYRFVM